VNYGSRIFVVLALVMGLCVPATLAQRPPAPPPPPAPGPPTTPNGSGIPSPSSPKLGQPDEDLVTFLLGRIATGDGTALPTDASVQRICNNRVRQQVYASLQGDFSMQLPTTGDSFVDASGDGDARVGLPRNTTLLTGIPRRDLANCELRATASGFRTASVFLAGLTTSGSGSIDVGKIVVDRVSKVQGTTLNAAPYNAPPNARKAYEKGLDAEKNGKLASARESYEKAVALYPKYARAWFHLGAVLEKDNQKSAAFAAYTRSTAVDSRFLPPYLSLSVLACQSENWTEAIALTDHILSLATLKPASAGAYVIDFDPVNLGEAYFYNAFANFKLNRMDVAEKNALQAENHADLRNRFPQVHLLLADIFYRRNNYLGAIEEMRAYLQLVPNGKDTAQVREQLAKWEQLSAPAPATEKPTPQ
jgi:hypothetical protein